MMKPIQRWYGHTDAGTDVRRAYVRRLLLVSALAFIAPMLLWALGGVVWRGPMPAGLSTVVTLAYLAAFIFVVFRGTKKLTPGRAVVSLQDGVLSASLGDRRVALPLTGAKVSIRPHELRVPMGWSRGGVHRDLVYRGTAVQVEARGQVLTLVGPEEYPPAVYTGEQVEVPEYVRLRGGDLPRVIEALAPSRSPARSAVDDPERYGVVPAARAVYGHMARAIPLAVICAAAAGFALGSLVSDPAARAASDTAAGGGFVASLGIRGLLAAGFALVGTPMLAAFLGWMGARRAGLVPLAVTLRPGRWVTVAADGDRTGRPLVDGRPRDSGAKLVPVRHGRHDVLAVALPCGGRRSVVIACDDPFAAPPGRAPGPRQRPTHIAGAETFHRLVVGLGLA